MVVYKQSLVCGRTPSFEWGGTPEHIYCVIGLKHRSHSQAAIWRMLLLHAEYQKDGLGKPLDCQLFVLITTSWTTLHVGLKTGIRETGQSKGDIWACSNCSRAAKQNPVRAWVLPVHSTVIETAACSEWKRLCLLFLHWLFHSPQILTLSLMTFVIEKW